MPRVLNALFQHFRLAFDVMMYKRNIKNPVKEANVQKRIWNKVFTAPMANKPNIQVRPSTTKQLKATKNLDKRCDSTTCVLRNWRLVFPHISECATIEKTTLFIIIYNRIGSIKDNKSGKSDNQQLWGKKKIRRV